MSESPSRKPLGLTPGVAALSGSLLVYGFGQELWLRYLPAYLRALGASAMMVGAFGALRDLLDAAYAYPGGVLSDRLGTRRALLLFGAVSVAGFAAYVSFASVAAVLLGLLLVMAWPALGLPASFALIGEELRGGRRIVGFTLQSLLKRVPIVVAPALGGLLIDRLGMREGMRSGFALAVLLGVAAWALLWHWLPRTAALRVAVLVRPRSAVRLHPALRQLLIADCLIRLCEGLPDVFLVLWVVEVVGLSPATFGLLIGILTATAMASYAPAALLAEGAEKKRFVILTYVFGRRRRGCWGRSVDPAAEPDLPRGHGAGSPGHGVGDPVPPLARTCCGCSPHLKVLPFAS